MNTVTRRMKKCAELEHIPCGQWQKADVSSSQSLAEA